MKVEKPISSEPVLYLMAVVMSIGMGVSMIFTTDHRWIDWHLSRLGEGGQLSAIIFNAGAGLCSLLMGIFAHRLLEDISLLKTKDQAQAHAHSVISIGFGCIAVCMMGIAVFPFDTFPAIHNVFGYGMTLAFVLLIVLLPRVLKVFSRRFITYTYVFVGCMAALFSVYFATGGKGIHLIFIEMLVLAYFYAWAIVLTKTIRQKIHGSTAKLQAGTE